MAEFTKALAAMTVKALRELARKQLGAGYSRLKTKSQLIAALAAVIEPAVIEPAVIEPAVIEPAVIEPAVIEPAVMEPKAGTAPPADGRRPKGHEHSKEDGSAGRRAKAGIPPPARPGARVAAAKPEPSSKSVSPSASVRRSAKPPAPRVPPAAPMAPAPPAERSAPRLYDERLGELPDRYQDDAFVALPLDPHSLFVYWDFAPGTTAEAARELPGARAVLRILEGGQPRQEFDFALESRSFYVHGLTPGGTYQAEIQFVSPDGRRRRIGQLSNPVGLPPQGPSSLVDDRFIAFPWDRGPLSAAAFEPRGAPGTPQHAELGELSATGASSWPPLRPWLPGGVRSAGVDWPGAGDRH